MSDISVFFAASHDRPARDDFPGANAAGGARESSQGANAAGGERESSQGANAAGGERAVFVWLRHPLACDAYMPQIWFLDYIAVGRRHHTPLAVHPLEPALAALPLDTLARLFPPPPRRKED